MNLYQSKNSNSLSVLKEKPFKLEKEIQNIFETNLQDIMGLQLVKSEFSIKNKRIDTLAFDKESQAFIIIEYKRDKNYSVVDQGLTYLNLMLQNKAEFILTYNETIKDTLLHSKNIDWSQSRVALVSPSFTENQISAADFKDFGIELWEIKQYENNIISINSIKKSSSAQSIKPLLENSEKLKEIKENIQVYTEEFHLKRYPEEIRELYEIYKNAIVNLYDGIEIISKKLYIAFKKDKNIADIVTLKKGIKIFINLKKGQLDDPKGLMKDVSETGHWGNGDYEITVTDTENLEYIMSLIKQAIK
jgi:predicted transport protein